MRKTSITLFAGVTCCVMMSSCEKKAQETTYDEVATPVVTNQLKEAAQKKSPHGMSMPKGMKSPHGMGMPKNMKSPDGTNPHKGMGSGSMGMGMPSGSVAPSSIKWTLPKGWTGRLNADSMIRIADFQIPNSPIECSLYAMKNRNLAGYIQMWRNQVGLPEVQTDTLKTFFDSQKRFTTANKKEGIYIDLIAEQPKADGRTIINAVIPAEGDNAYFLKITGKKSDLEKHTNDYKALAASIRF